MNKPREYLGILLQTFLMLMLGNIGFVMRGVQTEALSVLLPLLLGIDWLLLIVLPGRRVSGSAKLGLLSKGLRLIRIHRLSTAAEIVLAIVLTVRRLREGEWPAWFDSWSLAVTIVVFVILQLGLLISGALRILITARQVKPGHYIALFLLWWMPVVNLILIEHILRTARRELYFEAAVLERDAVRQESEICKTKYPILLVHGIFFRDWQIMNYWGRIPTELQKNGAQIFYGGQQSAQSVAKSAQELHERITQVLAETGAEKVNIIAHSKGGLDSRYAIGLLGDDMRVASLTTISSPHHGCAWAQDALEKIPASVQEWIARRYESIFSILGDTAPAFLEGVRDLTPEACKRLNSLCPLPQQIPVHCVMSEMNHINSAPFPLWVSYLAMKLYDRNVRGDGLVPIESAKLDGAAFTMVPKTKHRGISHGDMIDLSRENIRGFDVREFYVHLVQDLKKQGL